MAKLLCPNHGKKVHTIYPASDERSAKFTCGCILFRSGEFKISERHKPKNLISLDIKKELLTNLSTTNLYFEKIIYDLTLINNIIEKADLRSGSKERVLDKVKNIQGYIKLSKKEFSKTETNLAKMEHITEKNLTRIKRNFLRKKEDEEQ